MPPEQQALSCRAALTGYRTAFLGVFEAHWRSLVACATLEVFRWHSFLGSGLGFPAAVSSGNVFQLLELPGPLVCIFDALDAGIFAVADSKSLHHIVALVLAAQR